MMTERTTTQKQIPAEPNDLAPARELTNPAAARVIQDILDDAKEKIAPLIAEAERAFAEAQPDPDKREEVTELTRLREILYVLADQIMEESLTKLGYRESVRLFDRITSPLHAYVEKQLMDQMLSLAGAAADDDQFASFVDTFDTKDEPVH